MSSTILRHIPNSLSCSNSRASLRSACHREDSRKQAGLVPPSNSAIHSALFLLSAQLQVLRRFLAELAAALADLNCAGCSLHQALVPRAELLCLKDAHLCRSLQSSLVLSPSAENSTDTTNLSQELGEEQAPSEAAPWLCSVCPSLLLQRLRMASPTRLGISQHGHDFPGEQSSPTLALRWEE